MTDGETYEPYFNGEFYEADPNDTFVPCEDCDL